MLYGSVAWMNRSRVGSVSLFFTLSPIGPTMLMSLNFNSTDAATAQAEIQQLLDAQTAAWNRGDLEGFMSGYWRSPELTLSSGKECFRGWQPTLDRYQDRYRGDGHLMGQLNLGELEIELLGTDSALVRGRWHVATGQRTTNGLFTLILRKFPEGWRIIHDHTSV
jgi:beta-aspartyl-peptidase (threonine type)